ncbi:hypothetical protein E4U54_004089 [Claviceps lovelessii]|nr:hypothetical protein E4U54_004089 [Claviceps lovelessii]
MNIPLLLCICLLVPTSEAIISLVEIQKLLPVCSLQCLAQQVLVHGCALDDLLCQCRRIEPIIRTVSPCLVEDGCSLRELIATGKAIFEVCRTVPDDTTTAPSVESTTPSATPSAAASKTAMGSWWMGGVVAAVVVTIYW